jgi:hypothetical protein
MYRIQTLESSIYSGFTGRYRFLTSSFPMQARMPLLFRPCFGQKPENIVMRAGLPYLLEIL